jgi:hypothetical protein
MGGSDIAFGHEKRAYWTGRLRRRVARVSGGEDGLSPAAIQCEGQHSSEEV